MSNFPIPERNVYDISDAQQVQWLTTFGIRQDGGDRIVAAASMNQGEFLRLFLRNEREILRYVMTIVPNIDDAEEVVQESAVALWQQLDKYDSSQPFVAWACGFAANKAREYRRKKYRWRGFLDEDLATLLVQRRAVLAPELDRRVELLGECVELLPCRSRKIIKDYYYQKLSVEEVSQAVGTSVEAVYKALQRIRARLMDCVTGKLAIQERQA